MSPYGERMTRVPDLEELGLLVLVARSGSIGRAAAECGLAQPTVSRRMAGLERSLGVPLLDRGPRGTSLTPAGRVVVDWAAALLAAADDFGRAVAALRTGESVAVRAGVSMTIAEHYAPRWVARLHEQSPGLAVSFLVRNSTEVADQVAAGAADIGFIESPTVRNSLDQRRIGVDRLLVAVHPDHPWARAHAVRAADVASAPLLVREPGSGTRETLEHALRQHGLELTAGLEMASNTALTAAARSGMGPVVLSQLTLDADVRAGYLVAVPVPDLDLRRPLTAVWRRNDPGSAGVATLLRIISAGAGTGTDGTAVS